MESKGRTNVWLLLLGVRIGIILEIRVYSLVVKFSSPKRASQVQVLVDPQSLTRGVLDKLYFIQKGGEDDLART